MSNAALLKVYDGQDPEIAFLNNTPGTSENIAQVLLNTPNPGDAGGSPLTDVGAFACLSITKAGAAGPFLVSGEAGNALNLVGPVAASLTATTGNASVTATAGGVSIEAKAGVLELDFDGAGGELKITPLAAAFTPVASVAAGAVIPNYSGAVRQLQIKIGAADYYIALNPVAFA